MHLVRCRAIAFSIGVCFFLTAGAASAQVECPPFTPGNNLDVCAATYLGGPSADDLTGVDIAPDGTVVVAGAIAANDFGVTPAALLGGGDGVVLRISRDGQSVTSITRIGQRVADLDVDRVTGNIAVAGDFGVALLDSVAGSVLFSDLIAGGARRVAIGSDGTIAALHGNAVNAYDAGGSLLASFTVPTNRTVNDLTVSGADGLIIVTGYKQDDGAPCSQLKVAFVRAYDYRGALVWANYDWARTEVGSECADTQGDLVVIGRDGLLYFVGDSAGGNSIYSHDPQDFSSRVPNVATDSFNNPFNTSSNKISYYARLSPSDGSWQLGQYALSRQANGRGNTLTPRAVAADESGRVLLGGASACCMANRDRLQISGMPAGPYAGDNFVLYVSPDFRERLSWSTWTGTGSGTTTGVAIGNGVVSMIAVQTANSVAAGDRLLTVNPLQPDPAGNAEGFVSVWAAP